MADQVLDRLTDPVVAKGLWQVGFATVLAVLVLVATFVRGFDVSLEREFGVALVRGFVQIVAMGMIVGVLFTVQVAWSGVVLLFMIGGGAWIAHDRASGFPGAFRVAGISLLLGAGTVIVTMTATGVIEPTVRNLLPVGSMIVANAMKTASLAFDRFTGELENNREEIEAVLALGVPPSKAVDRYVERSVQASLIPVVDSLKSLGWVWIPGMMSGMVLGGENPIYAAEYQFVIMAMIFAAGGLTSLTSSFFIGEYAFTDAEQLRSFDGEESGADLG